MGLDLAFSKTLCDLNGIDVRVERRCDDDTELEMARMENRDDEYIAWLEEEITLLRVPGMNGWVEAFISNPYVKVGDNWVKKEDVTDYVIRANKWGHVYGPMTNWLKVHHISWSEF